MPAKDPDDSIVAIFKNLQCKDDVASLAAGRPIFVDEEIVELHYPGSKNWSCTPGDLVLELGYRSDNRRAEQGDLRRAFSRGSTSSSRRTRSRPRSARR